MDTLIRLTITIIDKNGNIIIHQRYKLTDIVAARATIKILASNKSKIIEEDAIYKSKTIGNSVYVKWIDNKNESEE